MSRFTRLLCEDEGQDLVEYGLLASFISIVSIVSINTLGPLVLTIYQNIHVAIRFARGAAGI